jgi:hypothetical protein
MCEAVCGIYEIVHLWPYISQNLFLISVTENRNDPESFNGNIPYRILRKSVQRFKRRH